MTNAQLCFLISMLWFIIPQKDGEYIGSIVFGCLFFIASIILAVI